MSFDSLNETFDVSSEIVSSEPIKPVHKEIESLKTDTRKDYEYTRGNLYSLIEKGQEAVNGVLELAQETKQARAYEVAGQLIKSVADTTDKLVDLQKKVKDLEDDPSVKTTNNVTNNALFVGSTSDLQKLLKQGFLNNSNSDSDGNE